jgi:hypothetical protein
VVQRATFSFHHVVGPWDQFPWPQYSRVEAARQNFGGEKIMSLISRAHSHLSVSF